MYLVDGITIFSCQTNHTQNSWCGNKNLSEPSQQRRCVVIQPCRVADWSPWETPQQGCRGDDDQVEILLDLCNSILHQTLFVAWFFEFAIDCSTCQVNVYLQLIGISWSQLKMNLFQCEMWRWWRRFKSGVVGSSKRRWFRQLWKALSVVPIVTKRKKENVHLGRRNVWSISRHNCPFAIRGIKAIFSIAFLKCVVVIIRLSFAPQYIQSSFVLYHMHFMCVTHPLSLTVFRLSHQRCVCLQLWKI